jgi:hypothetical protein
MDKARKHALATGVLFILTFITSIPALILYGPVLNDSHYILGVGTDTRIYLGAFLEILLMISNIGTAVAIFPVIKRQNESLSLGYVASRIVESTIVGVGIIGILGVVTMRREFVGSGSADATSLIIAGKTLVAIHKGSFLLGPGFCAGIENGLLLGFLFLGSGLMPRPVAILGLVGGTFAFFAGTAELFSLWSQTSHTAALFIIPEFLFEAVVGIWLTVKGFSRCRITETMAAEAP